MLGQRPVYLNDYIYNESASYTIPDETEACGPPPLTGCVAGAVVKVEGAAGEGGVLTTVDVGLFGEESVESG